MPASPIVSIHPATRACVLITPSPHAGLWHDRVHRALGGSDHGWDVLVTSDIDQALGFAADHWAVLMPAFDASGDVALLNNRTRDISRALAVAADAPGVVTIIDDALLSTRPPVELLPGTPFDPGRGGPTGSQLSRLPEPLAVYRTGRPSSGATVAWRFDLLHTQASEEQGFSSELSFDMSGKARILAWGPHITLSAGQWQMDLEFEVDQRGAKNALVIDWGSLSAFSRLECRPGQPGVHRATLRHRWTTAEVAELRFGLGHGAFSGRITLRSMQATFVS